MLIMAKSLSTVTLKCWDHAPRILSVSKRFLSKSPCLSAGQNVHDSDNQTRSLIGRDFLSLKDFQAEEIKQLLWTAIDLKTRMKDNGENCTVKFRGSTLQHLIIVMKIAITLEGGRFKWEIIIFQPLRGKTAAMIFQKRSTRTRTSTELGISKLGGSAIHLGTADSHVGVSESIKDTARVLSGMADLILARVHGQEIVDELANEASIPVISGLSDLLHPLQILADFMTLQEHFGALRGLKIAWVGDGNNILHSLMYGCAKLGIDLSVAFPPGYEPDADVMSRSMKIAGKSGASFQLGHDPLQAVYRADVIVTDTWVSMGQEEEKKQRLQDFVGFQVTRKMTQEANANWVFLHCLPRKKEEVTDDVFYGKESLVWQEAENRMWTVMAVMLHQLMPYNPTIPKPTFVRG